MTPLTIVIIILVIVSVITFFIVNTYNTLVLLKNKINDDWRVVTVEINYRYELTMKYLLIVGNYINPNLVVRIQQLESAHKTMVAMEPLMNNYIELERSLFTMFVELEDKKIVYADWINAFKESKQRLDVAREYYNNDVLAMNNKVELFPFSIVGTIGKFNKQVFFRNEN